MSKKLNIGFSLHAPVPIDDRLQVSTFAALSTIPVVYEGLKTYVKDVDKEYRYYSTGWEIWSGSGTGEGIWGGITGTLADQTDLVAEFFLKFNKVGGVITGWTQVQDIVEAENFILFGSSPSETAPIIPGTRVTILDYEIDWDLGTVFLPPTLTQATTLTEINLPQSTDTRKITMWLTGNFALTLPAYYTLVSGAYDGTAINEFEIECIDGTLGSEIVYYKINTL